MERVSYCPRALGSRPAFAAHLVSPLRASNQDIKFTIWLFVGRVGGEVVPAARRANQFVFCQFACPAPFAKIFPFSPDPNQMHIQAVLSRQRGVSRSSRTRGRMRWTRERQARRQSQGEMNLVSGQLACKTIGA